MYSRFTELLKERGISATALAKTLNFSPSTLTDWKHGRTTPKADKLQLIADYFDVSLDWLLGNTDVREKVNSDGYYDNPDAAEYAEMVRTNPEMKLLFSAAKDISKESMKKTYEYIKFLKSQEKGSND